MKRYLKKMVLGIGLAATVTLAHAMPVHWTLNNAKFMDNTSVTGSFVFDATTGTYSNVLVATSFASYDTSELFPIPFGVDATGIELVDGYAPGDNTGKRILLLDFLAALTDAGGVVSIRTIFPPPVPIPSFEGICGTPDCAGGTLTRFLVSGTVVGTTGVPEPGSIALFGIALAGVAATRRKKRA